MLDQVKIKNHFKSVDPVIYQVMQDLDFSQWWNKEKDYFTALCEDIVGQQLSGKVADAIFSRFRSLFNKELITPDKLLTLTDQKIRDIGASWAKVKYLKDLAFQVNQKTVSLEKLAKMTDNEVIGELTRVKGIGLWTAEMFLMFTLHRENIFSLGDFGLNKAIKKLYGRKRPETVIENWSPYRSFGCIALWQSLV